MTQYEEFAADHIHTTPEGRHFRHGDGAQVGVALELCRSNSIGSRHCEPSVIETKEASREEADALLAAQLPNGFYWRELVDKSGN